MNNQDKIISIARDIIKSWSDDGLSFGEVNELITVLRSSVDQQLKSTKFIFR